MLKTKVTKRTTANSIGQIKERRKRFAKTVVKTIIKENKPLSEYKDHGSWHGTRDLHIKGRKLKLAGLITGCGLGQIHGVTQLGDDISKKEFIAALQDFKKDGVGAVLCTLGANHYQYEKTILNLGFEKMAEYSNYRHGDDGYYKQRMYLLKL